MAPERSPRVISASSLEARLGDPALAAIEVAFQNDDSAFREAHVPGARWSFWKELLWHDTDRQFPSAETLAARLGALGIEQGATIVLVGDPFQFGTYAFWVMHMLGRTELLLLDGGRRAWIEGGHPVESGRLDYPAARQAAAGEDMRARIGRDGVLDAMREGRSRILDLRSAEEYRGERVAPLSAPFDHGAERRGRIPGARHLPHDRLLREDGTFRPVEELRRSFDEVGVGPDDEVIAYCRLSHRASMGWFALTELLGHERVRVYDGSWTEWGSIVGVPIER
ncbi:MAG TPA: sulfurtransferase [Gaiellaceae bacterium]|jgi:thiosulfate/3-mercaptopyruvate sulfurtransferase